MRMCPNCGCEDQDLVWTNGSGQIQCDNCGYEETEDDINEDMEDE